MSESNLRRLRNAYRHPFEYISPLLYRRNIQVMESEGTDLKASKLFCANEDDFNRLSQSPSDGQ